MYITLTYIMYIDLTALFSVLLFVNFLFGSALYYRVSWQFLRKNTILGTVSYVAPFDGPTYDTVPRNTLERVVLFCR